MLKDTSCNLLAEMINAMSAADMYEFVVQYGTHEQARTVYPRAGLIEELSNNSTTDELLNTMLMHESRILPHHYWYIIAVKETGYYTILSIDTSTARVILEQLMVEILDNVGIHTPRAYEMLYDYVERHFTNKGENDD